MTAHSKLFVALLILLVGACSSSEPAPLGGAPSGGGNAGECSDTGGADGEGLSECADPDCLGGAGCGGGGGAGEACEPGTIRNVPFDGDAIHHPVGTDIDYDSTPPAAGSHYPSWTHWAADEVGLDSRYWVHNLEHGGIVFLYGCQERCDAAVGSMRAYAAAVPSDDGGAFRWVLTTHEGLSSKLAVVAWEWIYEADCWNEAEVAEFVAAHYRQGPEDVAAPPSGSH